MYIGIGSYVGTSTYACSLTMTMKTSVTQRGRVPSSPFSSTWLVRLFEKYLYYLYLLVAYMRCVVALYTLFVPSY